MVNNRRGLFISAIIILLLALQPFVISRNDVISLFIMIFLIIALSSAWNLLGGYAGQVNFGYSAFFGIGALITNLLIKSELPFLVALLMSGMGAVLLGFIIGVPCLRLRGAYFAIGTLAVAEAVAITIMRVLPGTCYLPPTYMASYTLVSRYYLFLALAAFVVLVVYLISRSKVGLGMMCLRDDEDAAAAIGVNVFKHKLTALCISNFLAGLVGGAFAFYHVAYYYDHPFSIEWTVNAMVSAVIGGMGTITGPIIGSLVFVALQYLFVHYLGQTQALLFGILFILVVLRWPGGLAPAASRIGKYIDKFNPKHVA